MEKRPHIVLITSDQQRGDSLGCMGHPCVRTPHLDMLATEALRFDQAYTDCPICIPARTTMVTGIQSHVYRRPDFAPRFRIDRPREQFLGALLTRAGYQSRLVGKTHYHTDPSFAAGFESWVSWKQLGRDARRLGAAPAPTGIGGNEMSPLLSTGRQELQSTNWAVSRSIEFLEDREQDRPMFLWTSLIDPHPPNVIHEPYYSMYDAAPVPEAVFGDWAADETCPVAIRKVRYGNAHAHMRPDEARKARGVYYGLITNIDHQLGRLFGTLMRLGMWDDTVILYTTDHGEHLGDHGMYFKGTFLEGAAHIPLLVRCPKWMQAQRGASTGALAELADLLPTLCDITGAEVPPDVTGRSLLPLLRGQVDAVRDDLHGQIGNQHMFHDGKYKYLYFADDGRELLFDKAADPLDERDLSGDEALTASLRDRFCAHLQAEGSEHLVDGELVNLHQRITHDDETNVIGWMGLR